jgi:methylaspartate mutase epsilon subunit
VVNHGVAVCRQVNKAVQVPVQVRHGTPDARLLAEISIAGGFTSFEGGGISYNIPYAKNNPLEKTIRDWQYVDRLTGLYEEAGVAINREPFGPLTGTLVPPCIAHAVSVIESLLAAE